MSETPHVPPSPPPPPPGGSYTPPPPPPPGGAPVSGDRTIFLVLSYLGILCLIPLLAKKDDPEVQWHAKNGLGLFIAELVWVALRIALIFVRVPGLGCGMATIGCVVWIGFLVLSIMGIIKAVNGQRFRIPILTDMAEKM
jgi:fumarate reductase subunit D